MRVVILKRPSARAHAGPLFRPIPHHVQHLTRFQPVECIARRALGRCTAHELKALGARVALLGRTREKLEKVDPDFRKAYQNMYRLLE